MVVNKGQSKAVVSGDKLASSTVKLHEREYTVILERAESGKNWGAHSPDAPGCVIALDTTPERTENPGQVRKRP